MGQDGHSRLLGFRCSIRQPSSYLPEVYELADTFTLHVFRSGGIAASHGHKDASHETILTEAIGV